MKKLLLSIAGLALLLGALPTYAASYPVGGTTYYLAGAGINSSASTIQLTSFKTPDGNNIIMTSFGAKGYGALEVGTSKLENVSFTGVTQNANGTATLTGVSRGLLFTTPFTASTTLAKAHSGAANFVLSNTASYYGDQFAFVNNPSVVTDYWTFPSPLAGSNPATKTYVDNLVSGGTITSSSVITPGTAGETVSAGQAVYLSTTDGRWYKAGTGVTAGVVDALLGISQGAGTAGIAITGGVDLWGLDSNQSGLTVGASYFLGATAGTISTATSTRSLGKARSTTSLYFTPGFVPQASFSGTTTIAASNVNSKALNLNGVNYAFPATQGASSTMLTNNGSGSLSWTNAYSQGINPSFTALSGQTLAASTTLISFSVPAGSLGTANTLKIRLYMSSHNQSLMRLAFSYGGATTTIAIPAFASAADTAQYFDYVVQGSGATNSQRVVTFFEGSTTAQVAGDTYAIDSTAAQQLLIVASSTGNAGNGSINTFLPTVEVIR